MRRFNNNMVVRIAAFLLCITFAVMTVVTTVLMISNLATMQTHDTSEDILWEDKYVESLAFADNFNGKLNVLASLIMDYKSKDYIKEGKGITKGELEEALRTFYYEGVYDGDRGHYDYTQEIYSEPGSETEVSDSYVIHPNERYPMTPYENCGREYEDPVAQKIFQTEYAADIQNIKELLIEEELNDFEELQKCLDEKGVTYYASDGTNVISNLDKAKKSATEATGEAVTMPNVSVADFQDNKVFYSLKDSNAQIKIVGATAAQQEIQKKLSEWQRYWNDNFDDSNLTIYMGLSEDYINAKQQQFSEIRAEILKWVPYIAAGCLLTLISFIYLIVTTGRKDDQGNIRLYKVDKGFTEIYLVALCISFILGGSLSLYALEECFAWGRYYSDEYIHFFSVTMINIPGLIIGAVLFSLMAALSLWFLLACIRKLKGDVFFKDSLIVRLLRSIWGGIKEFYYGGSVMKKVVLISLAICLLSATMFLAPVVFILLIVFAPKWVKEYEEIKKGVEEVKSGNLSYKIPLEGEGELTDLAKGINEISAASNLAIQNELKNQRLKTDLISNVSHDLKTPLTSIITYIDLLKQEGLDHEEAPKYLDILDQKSQRLKNLTEDLFDAAKASSGAIPVKFEKVDMLSLIYQGLGELSDRIAETRLEFKINAEQEKYYVHADGQLLWRVVENLLGNVLKYAQEGSRVYIDLREERIVTNRTLMVIMEMKNISKNELNIPSDELMERFKRGDESRTTEGSGLGLAIAKDLVKLQNGYFEIKIDGDLFKAITMLESYEMRDNVPR